MYEYNGNPTPHWHRLRLSAAAAINPAATAACVFTIIQSLLRNHAFNAKLLVKRY